MGFSPEPEFGIVEAVKREEWEMRFLAAVIMALALAMPVIADAKPNCAKGKPCGNSSIAKDKVCHKP